jgi:hypothetical protein
MNPRRGPPPVEALPDAAWGRVEHELWMRLDRNTTPPPPLRGRRWIWLAVPALAIAAVLLVMMRGQRSPSSDDAPARVVAGDAPSTVSFGDTHITLDARSALVMLSDRHTVLLENGAAWFIVGPRGDRPAFEVRAGDATVRVIGTRFRVSREGEDVAVQVDHGVVAVAFRGNQLELTANQSWSSPHPDAGVVTASAPPATVPAVPDRAPSVPGVAHQAPTIAKSAPRCDADCSRYRALEQLEAKDADVAIKGYLELSRGSGKWAAVALYAAGRLASDRRDARAPALLSTYLHRFPTGENASDVSVLIDRLKGPALPDRAAPPKGGAKVD